jgi:hypothetical protein
MADAEDDKDPVPVEGEGKTRMFEMKMESWLQDVVADFGPDAPAPGAQDGAHGAPPPAAGMPPEPFGARPSSPDPFHPPAPPQAFPGLLDPAALLAAASAPQPGPPLDAPVRPSSPNMLAVQAPPAPGWPSQPDPHLGMGPPPAPQATDPFASTVLAPSPFAPPPPDAPAPPAAPFPEAHAASAVPPIPALVATAVPPIPGLVPGVAPPPAPPSRRWIGVILVACMLTMFAVMGTAVWWFAGAYIRALLKR